MTKNKETKKDDIADFCRLIIKINNKTKGKVSIGQLLWDITDEEHEDSRYPICEFDNESLIERLKEKYETLG